VAALPPHQALARDGRRGHGPYGPLYPTRDRATGREILALPNGFAYTTFGYIGARMSDGNVMPLALDGMAASRIRATASSFG
jgi:hypothetical protein